MYRGLRQVATDLRHLQAAVQSQERGACYGPLPLGEKGQSQNQEGAAVQLFRKGRSVAGVLGEVPRNYLERFL